MRRNTNSRWALVVGLMVAAFGLQSALIQPAWKKNYWSQQGFAGSLSPDQVLLQLFGFREFLSGILWVRADSFFDEGNYDAVLPIIRLCTILDPKQIDVYSTGMWHIAYNFTDEEQRSDRRYVPSALALGKEGSRQNPNTYELFFETGWIWYHKIDDDYHQAVKWFRSAQERPDMLRGRRNLLSNALQHNGQLDEALENYWKLFNEAYEIWEKDKGEYQNFQMKETLEGNLDTMVVRMTQRGWLAQKRGEGLSAGYDTTPPFDVGFSARVIVEDVKVIRVQGTWNVLPVGTRIRLVLRDADRPTNELASMDWDGRNEVILEPDREMTFMQDQLFVKNRRFNRRVDMSKDPTMYPFSRKSKEYIVEFYYNPRSGAPHIQDKFGWNGEGMTDANFLRTDIRKNRTWVPSETETVHLDKNVTATYTKTWKLEDSTVPSARVMYASLKLTRDMIYRKGEWADRTPIVQTKNFDATKFTTSVEDVIDVPNIRSQSGKADNPAGGPANEN